MDSYIKKVRTGIPGFDTIVGGGLREGKTIVLSGPPGSGKSTFSMQFIYYGAIDFNEPGIFVTLVQSPQELINDYNEYGWDLSSLIEQEKILIIDARPFKINDSFEESSLYNGESLPFLHLTQLIQKGIRKINAKRLVIDSISLLTMQYANQFNGRQGLQRMINALDEQHCTTILASETPEGRTPFEWYVASGIILLNHTRKENTMARSIQVIKMRGIKHSENVHLIKFKERGYEVIHPRITA